MQCTATACTLLWWMATRNTAHIFACSMLFRLARGFTHMTMPWEWHAAQLPCCASEMNPSEENMPLPLSPALNGPSAEQCCDLNSNSLSAVSCMLLLRPEDMVISLELSSKHQHHCTWHRPNSAASQTDCKKNRAEQHCVTEYKRTDNLQVSWQNTAGLVSLKAELIGCS